MPQKTMKFSTKL